ncbi:GIY-YIG nuclease family protein [Candidatus Parcubacteria bacterium]|nr:GIY-YIG nuclease family protein [Candidatus Parcubacteria bacterium]
MYKVYILLCTDLSFYIGHTDTLSKRIKDHNNKNGSFYLNSKIPVKLVHYETYQTRAGAMRREKQLKGWTRQKKINLIKYGHPTKIKNIN